MKILSVEMIKNFRLPFNLEKQGSGGLFWNSGKSSGRPFFHNQPDIRGRVRGIGELVHDLCGDEVGDVGKNLITAPGGQGKFEEITMDQFQIGEVRELCAGVLIELSVNLHGINKTADLAERFCQMALACADLQDDVVSSDTAEIQYFSDQLSFREKILRIRDMFCIVVILCFAFLHCVLPSAHLRACRQLLFPTTFESVKEGQKKQDIPM